MSQDNSKIITKLDEEINDLRSTADYYQFQAELYEIDNTPDEAKAAWQMRKLARAARKAAKALERDLRFRKLTQDAREESDEH